MREELKIVFQRDQIVLADFRVGGIRILHVDRIVLQRCVAEAVIDPGNVARRELVTFGQLPPAIASIEKFVREPELEIGMFLEIADGANPKTLGLRAAHDERVGVVESEFTRDADSYLRELITERVGRRDLGLFENFLRDRAGVFGIERNLSRAKRFPQDDRAAHSLTVFDRNARILDRASCDLREHVGLGEFLRTDDNRIGESGRSDKNN